MHSQQQRAQARHASNAACCALARLPLVRMDGGLRTEGLASRLRTETLGDEGARGASFRSRPDDSAAVRLAHANASSSARERNVWPSGGAPPSRVASSSLRAAQISRQGSATRKERGEAAKRRSSWRSSAESKYGSPRGGGTSKEFVDDIQYVAPAPHPVLAPIAH